MATIDQIKQLREETGVSPVEIKKALDQAGGNVEKAKEILRVWGKTLANKKTSKEARDGIIDYYVHPNSKTGVLLDIRCETDFVAKSPEFKKLAHEIAMQIASMDPKNPEELLKQAYIRDPKVTIEDLIKQTIAKVGENIRVVAFSRQAF